MAISAKALRRGVGTSHGGAVQVDPMRPEFKAPGTNLLTLEYDEPLSTFAFKFNLRRYTAATSTARQGAGAEGGTLPSCHRHAF